MIKLRTIVGLLTLMFSLTLMSQRRYAADRYFKEFSYKKSAELYERIYEKGDSSYDVLSRLGDSYYFNHDYDKAAYWYSQLMNIDESSVSSEHIFRYAQALKSTGKVSESDGWLLKLSHIKGDDSRGKALENNKDYFVKYSQANKTYINIHNLSINTEFSDFGGFVFEDKFYFASTRPLGTRLDKKKYRWNNQPYLNLYKSSENFMKDVGVLELKPAEQIVDVSTKFHESNGIITQDGTTMYFTRDNYDGNTLKRDQDHISHLKIYKAKKGLSGNWESIEELPFNSDSYSIGHPALSADEKILYFVSDMPGGIGETDIYKVSILENGAYGAVENLGTSINTEGREMFPFLDKDNTMYFASDGHLGLGALDIFESKYKKEGFTRPVNLGHPINGPFDDFSFVINAKHSFGYFSSNRKGGKGDDDIYSFMIFKCKEDIEGNITEKGTDLPIKDVRVRLINDKGEPVSETVTKADGTYMFELIDCENTYTVVASKEDYRNTQDFTNTEDIDNKVIVANLQLEPLIVESKVKDTESQIVIRPIYFDYGKSKIRDDAEYELEHIVTVMQNHRDMVIRIESHTDSRSSKAFNKELSSNRAKSTRDYLVSRGISPSRILSAIGYGETQLLNNCNDTNKSKCSEEEHQRNRRSYFYIVKGGNNVKVVTQD